MTENNDPLVRFVDIQKSYDGEILVIKNLNMDVRRGEFLTMLGPSGSGKTTCLMMVAGFEPATHFVSSIHTANQNQQPLDHSGATTLLDLLAGQDQRLDRPVTKRGDHQRPAGIGE